MAAIFKYVAFVESNEKKSFLRKLVGIMCNGVKISKILNLLILICRYKDMDPRDSVPGPRRETGLDQKGGTRFHGPAAAAGCQGVTHAAL